jgi:predicted transcriptional regulator
MHTADTQDKFMDLRAQGWSLGHIATEIHVSKRTLVDWNREFASDIQSIRTAELELLKEKIIASREEELDRLARLRKDVSDELANRTLKFVPIEKLFRLSVELREEMEHVRLNDGSEDQSCRPETNGSLRAGAPATNGTIRH